METPILSSVFIRPPPPPAAPSFLRLPFTPMSSFLPVILSSGVEMSPAPEELSDTDSVYGSFEPIRSVRLEVKVVVLPLNFYALTRTIPFSES